MQIFLVVVGSGGDFPAARRPDGKSFGVPLKVLPALGETNQQNPNLPCTFERNGDKMACIAAALKVQAGKREWLWLSR